MNDKMEFERADEALYPMAAVYLSVLLILVNILVYFVSFKGGLVMSAGLVVYVDGCRRPVQKAQAAYS